MTVAKTTVPGVAAGSDDTLADTGQDRTLADELREASVERFAPVRAEHYEILGELARGGLGRIFRARDARTGRIVAIKEVLRPDASIVLRFAREALVTANLQHPSIVPVYEVGRWPEGEPFYAMKLVRGRTLEACIAEARTVEERLGLVPHVIDVADALAYAHSEHVIHRDLKPSNVLVGAYGETVVIDWGLAKDLATGHELGPAPGARPADAHDGQPPDGAAISEDGRTVAGVVLGTPAYMPPEQASGEPLDERADVYAIGAILYHVLAGRWPYAGRPDVLHAVVAGAPTPLAELAPEAPPELVAIATKAMARAPADRYASAESLAADLRRFVSGQLVGAHRYSAWQLVRRWIARHRAVVITVAVALIALAVAAVISVREIAAERDEARAQRGIAERERAEAQHQRTLAEQHHATSLVELGRQALVEPNLDLALSYLVQAAELAPREPAVRATLSLLIGRARAAFRGLVAVAPGHLRETTSAALTDDGLLVSAGQEGSVRAWDLSARALRWQIEAPDGERRVALSPDGRWLVGAAGDDQIVVRAAHDGREHRRWRLPVPADEQGAEHLRGEQIGQLVWSDDSTHFALGTSAGRVVIGTLQGELVLGAAHAGSVGTLAFGPSGALASIASDGVTLVHDLAGAAPIRLFDGVEPAPLQDLVWLDAERLVSGGDDGIARRWNVREARVERRYAQPDPILGITPDPQGQWLATFGSGTTVTLWHMDPPPEADAVHARLAGHRIGIWRVVPVGDALLTVDESNRAFVWDPRTGELLQELPGDPAGKDIAVFGDRFVVYGRGRSFVWRLAPEAVLRRIMGHSARIRDLVFSPDGMVLWTASSDGTARGTPLFDPRAPLVIGTPSLVAPPIVTLTDPNAFSATPLGLLSVRLSPDGRRVAVGSEQGWIAVADALTGQELTRFVGHERRARRVIFAPDGATAYSVGDTTLRRWELATGRELARVELGAAGWDVARVGDALATLTAEAGFALWDAATLAPRPSPLEVDHMRDLVVSGDHLIAATRGFIGVVAPSGEVDPIAPHERVFCADAAPGPDGPQLVVVGDSIGQVAVYDGALALLHIWRADPERADVITAVRLRPTGEVLASSSGRRVRIWTLSGGLIAESPELPALILHLAWSPDGSRLAIAGGSGQSWLWDLSPDAGDGLAAFVRCVSHWTLAAPGAAAPFDPDDCAVLTP